MPPPNWHLKSEENHGWMKRLEAFHAHVDATCRVLKRFTSATFEKKFGSFDHMRQGYKSIEDLLIMRGCEQCDQGVFIYKGVSRLSQAATKTFSENEALDPPKLPSDVSLELLASYHSHVDFVMRQLRSFSIWDFQKEVALKGRSEPEDFGYKSLEHVLVFRGCHKEGAEYVFDEVSALQAKALTVAKYIEEDFDDVSFKNVYRRFYITNKLCLTKGRFNNLYKLLTSIRGMITVGHGRDTRYSLRRLDSAIQRRLVTNLSRGNMHEGNSSDSGEETTGNVQRSQKIINSSSKSPLKSQNGSAKKRNDSTEEESTSSDEDTSANKEPRKQKRNSVVTKSPVKNQKGVATKSKDSTDDESSSSSSSDDVHKTVKQNLVKPVAKTLFTISAAHRHKDSTEESSSSDDNYKNPKRNPAKTVVKNRPLTVSVSPKMSKKSSSEEDVCTFVKREPVKAVRKRVQNRAPVVWISSDDEEKPTSKKVKMEAKGSSQNPSERQSGANHLGDVVKGAETGAENGDNVSSKSNMKTKLRKAGLEAAVNESMQTDQKELIPAAGGDQLLQLETSGVRIQGSTSGIVPQLFASSNREFSNNSVSSQSAISYTSATENPPPTFQPGQVPPEHLLRMYMLMQQGIHGGPVPYMMPGQQPMPHLPPVLGSSMNAAPSGVPYMMPGQQPMTCSPLVPASSANPAPSGDPVTKESIPLASVKEEANSAEQPSNPTTTGNGNQSANNQPPLMNPGNQIFWGQQMHFGAHQPAPAMFHMGFPGGYGVFGLPGFGHPLQPHMIPHQPQMPPNFAHPPPLLPNNIMDFLGQYMGSGLAGALEQGSNPLDLAKKVLENVYGSQHQPPPQQ